MTIKYEPVFGDQSLFDTAKDHHVFACKKDNGDVYFHDYSILSADGVTIYGYIAMRRVIKTPTWTSADQESGVLPPVGAEVECGDGNRYEFIGITKHEDQWALRETDGVIFYIHKDSIYPIETLEEKAARLKDEWCETVYALYEHGSIVGKIYETLLSGELKAPTND